MTWLAFALNQTVILSGRGDYQILKKHHMNYFTSENLKFGRSDGFAIAAALIVDGDYSTSIAREVGEVKFYRRFWDENSFEDFAELPSRLCTRDDFDSSALPV